MNSTEDYKRLFDQGHDAKWVATELGVEYSTARDKRRRMGYDRIPSLRERSRDERIERVRVLSLQGVEQKQIAKELGCADRTVLRDQATLREQGKLPPRKWHPGRRVPPETVAKVEAMLAERCSFKDIHRTAGVSEHWLKTHYKGQGWTQQEIIEYRNMKKLMDRLDGKVRTPLSWT